MNDLMFTCILCFCMFVMVVFLVDVSTMQSKKSFLWKQHFWTCHEKTSPCCLGVSLQGPSLKKRKQKLREAKLPNYGQTFAAMLGEHQNNNCQAQQ